MSSEADAFAGMDPETAEAVVDGLGPVLLMKGLRDLSQHMVLATLVSWSYGGEATVALLPADVGDIAFRLMLKECSTRLKECSTSLVMALGRLAEKGPLGIRAA